MSQLTKELLYLKEIASEMMELVKSQFIHSKQAIIQFDTGLAESILRSESRVNALELTIEKECENMIALYQPVATDLRMLLSVFKFVSDLERMGDHARYFAKALIERNEPFDAKIIESLELSVYFNDLSVMFDDVIYALNSQDTSVARNVFRKDKEINRRFKSSVAFLNQEILQSPKPDNDIILLHSIVARLERTANLLTNIAEEIIFHVEAKVIKHNKQIKKELREGI